MSSTWYSVCQTLYPINTSSRVRDRPMEVLALGLSRSGTDSLRIALHQLGYDDVYHGMHSVTNGGEDCATWCEIEAMRRDGKTIDAQTFDKILGYCNAVTDLPAAAFGPELIAAYPEAKIIINKRKDVDAWQKSVQRVVLEAGHGWAPRSTQFFETNLFWLVRQFDAIFDRLFGHRRHFPRNAKEVHRKHYESLEIASQGREVLHWSVEEGWEPLCEFLEKPVPDNPFPRSNDMKQLEERVAAIMVPRYKAAFGRALVAVCLVLAPTTAWIWHRYFR